MRCLPLFISILSVPAHAADTLEPTAYPAVVEDMGENGPSGPILDMLEAIAEQNVRMAERLEKLESLVDERTRKKPERIFEAGTSLALRQGDLGRLIIEGNVKYFTAYVFAQRGGGFGFMPTIDAWRFRIHPITTGLLWYFDKDEVMTAQHIPRRWDILFSTGADVRIWRGLQARFQVLWVFPNPSAVGRYATRKAQQDWHDLQEASRRRREEMRQMDDIDDPNRISKDYGDALDDFGNDLDNDADIFSNAYKRAGKRPFYVLGLRWEF